MSDMRLVRTADEALIRSVIDHPCVKDWLMQDGDTELVVPEHDSIYYLAAYRELGVEPGDVYAQLLGALAFVPINGITWNPHIAVLPKFQGMGYGTEMMKMGVKWMFDNTPCLKIVAFPPE